MTHNNEQVRLSADVAKDGENEAEGYKRARSVAAANNVPLMTHHTFSSVQLEGEEGCPGGTSALHAGRSTRVAPRRALQTPRRAVQTPRGVCKLHGGGKGRK